MGELVRVDVVLVSMLWVMGRVAGGGGDNVECGMCCHCSR